MTQYPTQQWGPPQPPPPAPQPPIPPKRHNRRTAIILASVAAVLAVIAASHAASPTDTATPVARAPAATSAPAPAVTEPAVTSPPEPTYDTPKVADFKLTVKELTRQRFGSAGDLVDYRVQLTQVRDRSYDPSKSYELTYRISGGEDGAETQTMLITGDEYEQYEGNASTRGGVKVTAKAVSIEEA